jgi:uncharacterized protein (PEP-CTERM system associated)
MVLAGIACVSSLRPALAENWRLTASTGATETYTSNVNTVAQADAVSDFGTSVTATLVINGTGARAKLDGSIGATGLFYTRETQNNSIAPTVDLSGSLEAVEKFFFIDAQATVLQTFNNPFGPQPGNAVNATQNRYTSQTYRVSPYVRGAIPDSNVSYQLRDDNIWTVASQYGDASPGIPNTYVNQLTGTVGTQAAPVGWTLEYNGTRYLPADSNTSTSGSYTIQVGRGIVTYLFDPQVQVSGRAGYESDRFVLTGSEGPVYGIGGQWHPTDRTQMEGFWEHRFFGSSFDWKLSHRLPRTAISASFSRGIATFSQNSLTIPAGANVAAFVDAAFTTRITDPAERALAVQQFLARTKLPPTLATPVNFFAANPLLQTAGNAAVVLAGARNSMAFNLFYLESEEISGTGSPLPPALQSGNNNTQSGGGVAFNHQLTGLTNLTASASYSTTRSNNTQGLFADVRSQNGYLNLGVTTQLAPKTTASAGVGYSRYVTHDVAAPYTAPSLTVYVGFNHTF